VITLGLRYVKSGAKHRFTGVLLDSTDQSRAEPIEYVCVDGGNQAGQAHEAYDWIVTILSSHPVERVLLYEADWNAKSGDRNRPRLRLEGAVLAGAYSKLHRVDVKNGPQLGSLLGGTKAEALELGAAVGLAAAYTDAATAALAAAQS
jgi:hypothetical protein